MTGPSQIQRNCDLWTSRRAQRGRVCDRHTGLRRMGAYAPSRTHCACRYRRRRRSDGARHPGHRGQAQPDEAVDGRHQQGRRSRRRRLPRRERLGAQSAQADHHAVEPVHHAARHRHSGQLEGPHAGRHDGARRVRALGQCRDAVQDREGLHRRREGRAARAVQDGRHRLEAGRPDHHGRDREVDRHQVHLHSVSRRRRSGSAARRQARRIRRSTTRSKRSRNGAAGSCVLSACSTARSSNTPKR